MRRKAVFCIKKLANSFTVSYKYNGKWLETQVRIWEGLLIPGFDNTLMFLGVQIVIDAYEKDFSSVMFQPAASMALANSEEISELGMNISFIVKIIITMHKHGTDIGNQIAFIYISGGNQQVKFF